MYVFCSSLTEDDIPTKLRCAICSKLAVNAFKLPCCEQLIDETCECFLHLYTCPISVYLAVYLAVYQPVKSANPLFSFFADHGHVLYSFLPPHTGHSTLPSTCPVCEHTPLSAADCNPNKVMRSTIRVFIKTELKKRETTRAKQTKEAAPLAPATPVEAAAVTAAAVLSTTAAVTGDMAAANANAMEEAQQQQGMMGSSTTYSSSRDALDNAPIQFRAEDSQQQMQESGHHAGTRPQGFEGPENPESNSSSSSGSNKKNNNNNNNNNVNDNNSNSSSSNNNNDGGAAASITNGNDAHLGGAVPTDQSVRNPQFPHDLAGAAQSYKWEQLSVEAPLKRFIFANMS